MTVPDPTPHPARRPGPDRRSLAAALVVAVLPTYGLYFGGSYAALAFGLTALLLALDLAASRRPLPVIDRPLAMLGFGFVVWAGLGLCWSIAPQRTLIGDLQMAAVLATSVLLVSWRAWPEPDLVLWAGIGALIIGPLVAAGDMLLGYPLMTLVHHKASHITIDAHYNRGLCHLALIIWPLAFWMWTRHQSRQPERRLLRWAIPAVALSVLAVLLLGSSFSARLAFFTGLSAFLLARVAPLATAVGLGTGALVLGAGMPWLLRACRESIEPIVAQIKASGVHRLEIWDYMTARIQERPLLGWGFEGAKSVPIRPDEMAHYQYVTGAALHPHNQWLQLWVELGAVGVALGLGLVLVVLLRAVRLPDPVRPFGLAAIASALVLSGVGIDLSTDSWWAALALTAFLFTLAETSRPDQRPWTSASAS